MRLRTAAVSAVAVLALSACSGPADNAPPKPAASSATASPTLDRAAARQACIDGWGDVIDSKDMDDIHLTDQPAVCKDLGGESSELFNQAIQERHAASRESHDACVEDPTCDLTPEP